MTLNHVFKDENKMPCSDLEKKIEGQLRGVALKAIRIANQGESRDESGPLDQLDVPSLRNVWTDAKVMKVSSASDSMRNTGAAFGIRRFHGAYGCLPPQAIVDQQGRPLLSWRVAILPYMGYSRLFHMFKLDEPWDSPHNRRLIPLMPRKPRPQLPLWGRVRLG